MYRCANSARYFLQLRLKREVTYIHRTARTWSEDDDASLPHSLSRRIKAETIQQSFELIQRKEFDRDLAGTFSGARLDRHL